MRRLRLYISIRTKLILMVAGTLVLAIAATSYLVRGLVFENILKNKKTTVDILTASLVHDIKYDSDTKHNADIDQVIAKYITYYRVIQEISYFDINRTIVADSDPKRVGQKTEDHDIVDAITVAKPSLRVTRQDWRDLGLRSVAPILKGSSVVGAIVIDVSIRDIEQTLAAIDRRIALIMVGTVILASAALFFLVRHTILRRLSKLIDVTHEIAQGRYDIEVLDTRKDEIGELGRAFMRMTSDLKRSIEEIDRYNKHLEEMVQEGTAQLQTAYRDLQAAHGQAVQNEKMASLGVLIAGVAHEINTPVGAIVNVTRSMENAVEILPQTLAAYGKEEGVSSDVMMVCLQELIQAARLSRKSHSYKEVRLIEQLLREHGIDRSNEKAATLARLNFANAERIVKYIDCFKVDAFFSLAECVAGISQAATISAASSQKIGEIVRALKYYAYSDKDKVETIQLNDSIHTALVLLRNSLKGSVSISTDLDPQLPCIPCTSEIHQVWTNLLHNAGDAINEMGEDYAGVLVITSCKTDDKVLVKVTDNGIGIPAEKLGKVFDPFFTTKDIGKGTGLGLSIVSGIIKKHNGTVRVESRRGHTVFEISLPLTGCLRDPEEVLTRTEPDGDGTRVSIAGTGGGHDD
jgi:signal transduction histidine kinase